MSTATIIREKEYIVIRIPVKGMKKKQRAIISVEDKEAIQEGLRAIAKGRVSKPLRTAREAISFLRAL